MARIDSQTHIRADPARVWEVLVDWENQPRWMADARRVDVLGDQRAGVGVTLRCRTAIAGGLLVDDDIRVIEWEPPRLLTVRHLGRVVRGVGAFELAPTADGTRVRWWEEFTAPLGLVGEAFGQLLVAPLIQRVFRRSLTALKRRCEGAEAGPGG